eukprot:6199422-Pleurochrysis_carterae.AAC.3
MPATSQKISRIWLLESFKRLSDAQKCQRQQGERTRRFLIDWLQLVLGWAWNNQKIAWPLLRAATVSSALL